MDPIEKPTTLNDATKALWRDLIPVFARGNLVFVHPSLDFEEAEQAVTRDHSEKVRGWMDRSLFGNVTDEQAQAWMETPEREFLMVIRDPFVLVQPLDS